MIIQYSGLQLLGHIAVLPTQGRSQPKNRDGAHAESNGALGWCILIRLTVTRYGNIVGRIIEVTVRRARLVLRWVTAFTAIPSQVCNQPPRPYQPPTLFGMRNEYQPKFSTLIVKIK